MGLIQKRGALIPRERTMRDRGGRDVPSDPAHGTRASTDGSPHEAPVTTSPEMSVG